MNVHPEHTLIPFTDVYSNNMDSFVPTNFFEWKKIGDELKCIIKWCRETFNIINKKYNKTLKP